MSVEYLIVCDGCSVVLAGSMQNAAVARREAVTIGSKVAQPGGRDYCEDCASWNAAVASPHDRNT